MSYEKQKCIEETLIDKAIASINGMITSYKDELDGFVFSMFFELKNGNFPFARFTNSEKTWGYEVEFRDENLDRHRALLRLKAQLDWVKNNHER